MKVTVLSTNIDRETHSLPYSSTSGFHGLLCVEEAWLQAVVVKASVWSPNVECETYHSSYLSAASGLHGQPHVADVGETVVVNV